MPRRLWILALILAGAAHAAPLRVGTITVRVTPLFDAAEVSRGGFYRIAEKLQVNSRETLIREFLLFQEGDELDDAKLHETERNLRQLDFLRSVSVTAGPSHDGVVDVVVDTEDAWTTDIDADYSNEGDQATYSLGVKQKNLFNRGGDIELRDAKGLFRHTSSVEVADPEMFGPYWNADALVSVNSDGNEEKLSIERPLYSYATPYTFNASFDHLLQDARTFQSGEIDSAFRQMHREWTVQGGRVVRATPEAMSRLLAGADFLDDSFRAIQGAAPSMRHFRYLEIGADRTRFNVVSLDHVDYGMRRQDFNLGAHASLFAAVSPPTSGQGVVWRLRSDDSYGYAFGSDSFLLTHVTATTRIGATNRNAIVSDDTRFVVTLPAEHPQAFVARGRVDIGWDLDRDLQFFADAQNGLRAYPNFAFEGTRRIILNVEHRLFLGRELLQMIEPGVAVFVDTGEAVNGEFSRHRLRTDFGFGLRCGIARLDSTMLRLDVSYAINSSPTGDRGFEVSFATVQAF